MYYLEINYTNTKILINTIMIVFGIVVYNISCSKRK